MYSDVQLQSTEGIYAVHTSLSCLLVICIRHREPAPPLSGDVTCDELERANSERRRH
jgi:hypothetical protein